MATVLLSTEQMLPDSHTSLIDGAPVTYVEDCGDLPDGLPDEIWQFGAWLVFDLQALAWEMVSV